MQTNNNLDTEILKVEQNNMKPIEECSRENQNKVGRGAVNKDKSDVIINENIYNSNQLVRNKVGERMSFSPNLKGIRDRARQKTRIAKRRKKNKLRIATWNVRSLKQNGKLENVIQEMERMEIDVMGVSETFYKEDMKRRVGLPDSQSNYILINAGSDDNRKGVAFIYKGKLEKNYESHQYISNRIILLKMNTKPRKTTFIQVYAPTEDADNITKQEFYEDLRNTVRHNWKHGERLVVKGDFNSKVGKEREENLVGPYGLGERNENGDLMVDFCKEFGLVVTNTWNEQREEERHTWISPDGRTRNQIDYILIDKRYRNSVTSSKSRPEADCGSDHNPVVADVDTKLKKIKNTRGTKRWNLKRLEMETNRTDFQEIMNEKIDGICDCEDVNETWEKLKESIHCAADEICGREGIQPKKIWMTQEILEKMEERRQQKNVDVNRYREINREIKQMCKEAKEIYLNDKCKMIQELDERHNPLMYKIIKEMQPNSRNEMNVVKDKNDRLLSRKEDILQRFAEYIEELYDDNREQTPELDQDELQRAESMNPIGETEVRDIIGELNNGKAVGVDEIPAEMLKCLGEAGVTLITKIINRIYKTGEIPDDFKNSIFIPIPKLKKAENCTQFRTISLITHISKILLQIIKRRITPMIERKVSENQLGFRRGRGTREGIFQVRQLGERLIEMNRKLYMAFIDYSKAFDRVQHKMLMEVMKRAGLPELEKRLIANLYWGQMAVVKIGNDISESFTVKKGVRQGCILSPILFNLYTDYMIEEAFEDLEGIRINGENLTNIRYADDTVLVAESEYKLQMLLQALNDKCREYGMSLNENKTKVMVLDGRETNENININVQGRRLEQIEGYSYLGCWIDRGGKCDKEVRRRIGNAKGVFLNSKEMFKSSINIKTKKRLIDCYVFSVLTYGCEAWTLTKDLVKRIDAFEMWIYRRMLGITYRDRVTNVEVLRRMECALSFVERIAKRKMKYAGHVMRGSSGRLTLNILEGHIEGRRRVGRPRRGWIDDIKNWTDPTGGGGVGVTYGDLKRSAENRERWRELVRRTEIIRA